jgi:hypothetical protein
MKQTVPNLFINFFLLPFAVDLGGLGVHDGAELGQRPARKLVLPVKIE